MYPQGNTVHWIHTQLNWAYRRFNALMAVFPHNCTVIHRYFRHVVVVELCWWVSISYHQIRLKIGIHVRRHQQWEIRFHFRTHEVLRRDKGIDRHCLCLNLNHAFSAAFELWIFHTLQKRIAKKKKTICADRTCMRVVVLLSLDLCAWTFFCWVFDRSTQEGLWKFTCQNWSPYHSFEAVNF